MVGDVERTVPGQHFDEAGRALVVEERVVRSLCTWWPFVRADPEIEFPVVVKVAPVGADGVVLDADAELLADLGECAVAVVVVEEIAAVGGDEDVEKAVVVVVADGAADATFVRGTWRASHAERGRHI